MQPQFYMYCYPWDLEDEGLEESIGRLAGEIGVDGINVAATTSEILQYRPRKPLEKRVFKTEAGAHFQPDSKYYSSCRIKPHPAAWMKSRNALERIVKVCEKEKLKVRASVCSCVGRAMVKRYPFGACVNALGMSSESVLCPTHPDVREYLAAMVADLSTNYGIESIELTELRRECIYDFSDHEMIQPPRYPAADAVLGMCFCTSCQQNASLLGMNESTALRIARDFIERWLDDPQSARKSVPDIVTDQPSIEEYGKTQLAAVLEAISNCGKRSQCEVHICYDGDVCFGSPVEIVSDLLERIARLSMDSRDMKQDVSGTLREWVLSIDPNKVVVAIPTPALGADSAQKLVATVHQTILQGYYSISFSNYGIATQSMLDAIRQAIRFARRETR